MNIRYVDYALWQRDQLESGAWDHHVEYWQEALSGFENLELPTDRLRPAVINSEGDDHTFIVDTVTSERLRQLAKDRETSLYTVMLSGWYITLAALSGQSDIVVGSLFANRDNLQIQKVLGYFVNSLPLRTQIPNNKAIGTFIDQLHELVISAKLHQILPFQQIVDSLKLDRDTSRHPIFQAVFSLQSFGKKGVVDSDLPFTPVGDEFETEKYLPAPFELTLLIDDSQEAMTGRLNFVTSLFDKSSIERIGDLYQCVLNAFVTNVDQQIGAINLLSENERQSILHDWNSVADSGSQEKTLNQIFEQKVIENPDNIAVVFSGVEFTYQQLNDRANQLAYHLVESYMSRYGKSLKPDTLIGLYMERSIEMVIGILAILKAGGCYVPVVPGSGESRLKFILNDAQPAFVITQNDSIDELQDHIHDIGLETAIISVDNSHVLNCYKKDNLEPVSTSSDLAYVIYTSGTTGKPKGVLQQHDNVVRLFSSTDDDYQFSENDTWLLYHSYAFDFSVWELWGALL